MEETLSSIDRTVETAMIIQESFLENSLDARAVARNDRLFMSQWADKTWYKLKNNPGDYINRVLNTRDGKGLQTEISSGAVAMIEHARLIAERSPSGTRRIAFYITHDFVLEALLYSIVSEDEIKKVWPSGKIVIPFLDGLRVEITRDIQGNEQLKFYCLGKSLTVDFNKIEELKKYYDSTKQSRS